MKFPTIVAAAFMAVCAAVPAHSAGLDYLRYPTHTSLIDGLGRFPLCKGKLEKMADCIVDGDTVRIAYNDYRLGNLDTPESRRGINGAKCDEELVLGQKAKDFTQEFFNRAIQIKVITYVHPLKKRETLDKYGRILAKFEADGVDLAAALMAEGYARPYDGKTKTSWCH